MTSTERVGHFEYVVVDGEIDVYDIAHWHRFVQRIDLPENRSPHGVVAEATRFRTRSPSGPMLQAAERAIA
jgi:hypothetical protein